MIFSKRSYSGIGVNSITSNFNHHQVQHWLRRKNFSMRCCESLQEFSGEDILRLSRSDLIEILGSSKDGIRLYNMLSNKPLVAKKTIYISFHLPQNVNSVKNSLIFSDSD